MQELLLWYLFISILIQLVKQFLNFLIIRSLKQFAQLIHLNKTSSISKIIESGLESLLYEEFLSIYHGWGELIEVDWTWIVLIYLIQDIFYLIEVCLTRISLLVGLNKLILFDKTIAISVQLLK